MSATTSEPSPRTGSTPATERCVVVRILPGSLLVAADGDLDDGVVEPLRDAFRVAGATDAQRVIVDAGQARFVDRTALEFLASAARRLRSRGGALNLVSDVPAIRDSPRLLGLAGAFPVRPSLDAALESIVSRR